MKETGEWGEFFPIALSPLTYNESVAQDVFPLSREEALQRGYHWFGDDVVSQYQGVQYEIPDIIEDVKDDIVEWIRGSNAVLVPSTGKS